MSNILSLAKSYEKYFKIGAAVACGNIDSYTEVLREHFNSVTPENEMKYISTEPEEGKFTFGDADKIFDTARKQGIKVRAHAPVWHNQTGGWMFKDGEKTASPELIYQRIDAHSKALCERYNADVYAWDVVNEAVTDAVPDDAVGDAAIYRDSDYFKICGADFIAAAFRSMDKYSPNAQLFYNDYNECDPAKRGRIVSLIKRLKEQGCRVDGLGMQQHYFGSPDYDELKRSIEIYAELGLRLHITELDVSIMATFGHNVFPPSAEDIERLKASRPEDIAAIEDIYLKLFEIYRSYSDVIDCVTTWGVADDYTWMDGFVPHDNAPIVKQHPLLFDVNHAPKACVSKLIATTK